ncbi:MAG: dipeptidase [Bacillota bacterium]|jgi:membrane dipeptidase|nr:dipeptidase [Eubacteriales bacterium]MDD4286264.1 dipeptidase [Eubacteriales bacterium]MDI9491631.1 dipeptidase [Bacillota bacterium]NLV69803.1 membrane dipeptidase [Clostridiales bacterium]HRV32748.1 dipeptidase [Anaerovoracaceae bacterium]
MKIIDMHCDTLLECYRKKKPLRNGPYQINLEKLKSGGCLAQCFAIFVVSHDTADRCGVKETPYGFYREMVDLYQREITANPDLISPALCAGDIESNRSKGRMSSLLTVEDAVAVDGRIERIDEFFSHGVRMMSLTWNYENSIGYPNSPDPVLHGRKLKPFGVEAVERMNALGMIVDVSHLTEGGFDDVALLSRRPFVASHSCARALGSHQRNLTDRQLKVLGEKGGIVGINFCAQFLEDHAVLSSIDTIVRHMIYIRDKAGIEALAWGSDLDGIDGSVLEYGDYAGFPRILHALSRHFTEDELERINHGNFLRVFRENAG